MKTQVFIITPLSRIYEMEVLEHNKDIDLANEIRELQLKTSNISFNTVSKKEGQKLHVVLSGETWKNSIIEVVTSDE